MLGPSEEEEAVSLLQLQELGFTRTGRGPECTDNYDVALLGLTIPLEFNENVTSVELPNSVSLSRAHTNTAPTSAHIGQKKICTVPGRSESVASDLNGNSWGAAAVQLTGMEECTRNEPIGYPDGSLCDDTQICTAVTASKPGALVQPHPSTIRQWLRGGEVDKLEDVILHGQGHKLLGEYSSDLKVRAFLKTVPAYLARIDMINDAVAKGNLTDLQALLQPTSASGVPRKRISSLALCRDQSGNGVLHKAIYYGYTEMVKWLVENFPQTIHIRDRERRTPLHYCGSSEDVGYIWSLLTEAGAESSAVDKQGHTPSYYIDHPEELRLPSTPTDMPAGRFTSGRNGIVIKQSNIRIWIHDRDLGRLQQVVWEGHGDKLKTETSHQPIVRRFLNAIPYIMGTIKETHSAVVKNDLTLLKKKTEDPVPKQIFNSKDANGLTPLHKAAGLGHTDIVQYILDRYPNAVFTKDHEGRTALHYAAILKDNGEMFNLLKEYRADDAILDKKGKTASYYAQKPNEIDTKLLTVIPEAPRTASIAPASWDWRLLNQDFEDATDLSSKPPPTNSLNGDSAFEDMGQDESDKLSPQTLPNFDEGLDQGTADDYPSRKYDIYQQDVDEGVGYEPEEFQEPQETVATRSDPPPDRRDDGSAEENPRSPLYEEVEEPSSVDERLRPEAEGVADEDSAGGGTVRSDGSVKGVGEAMVGQAIEGAARRAGPGSGKSKHRIVRNPRSDRRMLGKGKMKNETTTDDLGNDKNSNELSGKVDKFKKNLKNIRKKNDLSKTKNLQKVPTKSNRNKMLNRDNRVITGNSGGLLQTDSEKEYAEFSDGLERIVNSETKITGSKVNRRIKNEFNSRIPVKNTKGRTKRTSDTGIRKPTTLNEYKRLYTDGNPGLDSILNVGKTSTPRKAVSFEPRRPRVDLKEITGELIENEKRIAEGIPSAAIADALQRQQSDVKSLTRTFIEKEKHCGKFSLLGENSGESGNGRLLTGDNVDSVGVCYKDWTQRFLDNERKTGNLQSKSAASNGSSAAAEEVMRDRMQSGSMEQLAEMVLRGEGRSLLTYKSDDPEVQVFLNNVPSYMAKIEAVHSATREGNLRALQYALDRRKFAVARENRSQLRLTPLHVAALYNRTSVLRFLAGRFPETLYARDLKGRTPLHYAATLRDNAHFYNLLITLGADTNFEDEDGRTAEYYLHNPDHVTHDQLMAEYERPASGGHAVTPAVTPAVSDRAVNDAVTTRRNNDDLTTLATLERCYRQLGRPPDGAGAVYESLNRFLTPDVFEKLKLRSTGLDHGLLDIIRPILETTDAARNDFASINVPDYESLSAFEELLLPLTKAINGITDSLSERHPNSNFFPDDREKYSRSGGVNLDTTGRILQSCRIECRRNLAAFTFPADLTLSQLESIENDLTTVLIAHYKTKDKTVKPEHFLDDFAGAYCSVCETLQTDSEIYRQLEFYGLLDPDLDVQKRNGKHWPYGRGVYINPNGNITVWINVREHLKVIVASTEEDKGELGALYDKLTELMTDLQRRFQFKWDERLGFLTSDLSFLGNGLKCSAVLRLPHLGEDLHDLRRLCDARGLTVEAGTGRDVFAVRSKRSLGLTEYSAFENFTSAVSNIVDLERNGSRAKAAKLSRIIGSFIGKM